MKKLLLSLIVTSLFIPVVYAKSFDACDEIIGHWSGSWFTTRPHHCDWRVKANSLKKGKKIYFNFIVHKGNCAAQAFAMTGTCKQGKVLLENKNAIMTGSLVDDKLKINGNYQHARLIKH